MDIHIRPISQTLSVAAGTNLLEALRAHGIPVSYSCMAGRCGTCRCKVVSGQVLESGREVRHAQAGDDPSSVLACQTFLTEPCTVEIPEPDEVVVHTARIVKATVVGMEDATHDIKRLRLRPARPMAFSPGQYAQLQFTPEHIRPYSMAGLCGDGELEFHVRLVPEGRVSGHIAHVLKLGDAVRVSGPLGSAYLRRRHEGPMLCVAGGTGLAPILSILRGALAAGMRNPMHLYFGVRSERDLYGLDWLADLQRHHRGLHLHTVVASGRATGRRTGLVTDAIRHDWSRLDGFRAYLCGAPPMVEATSLQIRQMGVLPEHIHADAFYASSS
ncbi:MAG: 2Fe-2S iron-sulfur cluster-binding protein [Hydrogenophaga sp.]|uniref:2Fe-2S iron-sulfur cluster-binding protein n=1 Tax=Hydrogenophaga sp. TaxID=1904254 RepID=UPI003D0AB427